MRNCAISACVALLLASCSFGQQPAAKGKANGDKVTPLGPDAAFVTYEATIQFPPKAQGPIRQTVKNRRSVRLKPPCVSSR